MGLAGLSTYGIPKDRGRDEVHQVLDLLEADGCLRQTDGQYPVLWLTERGVKVLKGEETARLALPRPVQEAPEAGRTDSPAQTPDDQDFDAALFERLRALRRRIAEELRLPAYRVFNDRTLRAMARETPITPEGLLEIPGVGEVTLERFGARFLGLLREHRGKGPSS
jgi:ATP-dependent DNA helicase RecQ